jgi:hypothetical protein
MKIEPLFTVANATIFDSLRRRTGWANWQGQGLINRDGYPNIITGVALPIFIIIC